MEKIIIFFIGIVVLIAFILIGVFVFVPLENPGSSNSTSGISTLRHSNSLEKGNGMVINIWIEKSDLNNLKNHRIRYLFVDIGDTGKDGKIKTSEEEIDRFIELINSYEKENNYDFVIFPYSEVNTYDYNINSETFRDNFINDYADFINKGFDGIYVDIEPVKIGEEERYLSLLDEISKKFPDKIVSVYSGAVSESSFRDNEWEWTLELYKKVSDKVDLIFVPGYDSDIKTKSEYQEFIKREVRDISSRNFNTLFLMGIPTHNPYPETIENALEAYNEEIALHPNSKFIGVGIFSEWTIDDEEWKVFEERMLG